MVPSILIAAITVVLMILAILFFPKIRVGRVGFDVYPVVTLIGAAAALLSGYADIGKVASALVADTAVNPLKILTLFISMTLLSIFLDEAGFFSYLAVCALRRAKNSQYALFFILYFTVSVLTVFTSNDIVILTFTPFICFFAARAGIDPKPYLFAEFVAANTWSALLVIGNPTNIYLATSNGIGFFPYFFTMAFPTVAAGAVSLLVLFLIFRRTLKTKIEAHAGEARLRDKTMTAAGIVHLGACTVCLAVGSYVGIEMWYVCLFFALSLFITVGIISAARRKRPGILLICLRRAPWQIVPFLLSMFVLILMLDENGVTGRLGALFSGGNTVFTYGLSSFFASNVINNIPMSVLFSSITSPLTGAVRAQAVYASILGSNIGAFFTPLGALAGIMWSSILRKYGIRFSTLDFIRYGAPVALPSILCSLLALAVVL